MAKRPTTTDITNIETSAGTINNNFDAVKGAFDNTLSRDGSTPNEMEADLDMNSNDILNARRVYADSLSIGGERIYPAQAFVSESVADLQAKSELVFEDYSDMSSNLLSHGDGTVVTSRAEGFSYLESSASPFAINSVGVIPQRKFGAFYVDSFGARSIGTVEGVDPEITGSEAVFNSGFDSGPAIVAAVEACNDSGGGVVMFGPGVYKTSETITLDSGTFLVGTGYTNCMIRLAAGANRDVVSTRGFAGYNSTDSWIVASTDIPWGYGLEKICIDGNRDNNTAGYCFRGYGKLRSVWHCMFKNSYQWGFFNGCGTSRGQSDFRDIPEARVWAICRNNRIGGFWGFGPHDWMIDHLVSAFNGRNQYDWDILIEDDGVMSGGGRFKFMHTYGGPASGINFKDIGVLQGDHMVAENGFLAQGSGGYINLIQNGSAIYGRSMDLRGGGWLVGQARLSTNDASHDALRVEGSDCQIGLLKAQARDDVSGAGQTGRGIDLRDGSDGFKVNSLRLLNFREGVYIGANGPVENVWVDKAVISSCAVGVKYATRGQNVNVSGRINVQTFESGTHTGLNGASALRDSTTTFYEGLIGTTVRNTTDGSEGVITAATSTTVTASLSGGTTNTWNGGDAYDIIGTDYDGVSPDDKDCLDLVSSGSRVRYSKRVLRTSAPIDATGVQTVSINPSLLFDPDLANIRVYVVRATSSSYALNYEPRVNGTPTKDNIDIRYSVSSAASAGAELLIGIEVDIRSAETVV